MNGILTALAVTAITVAGCGASGGRVAEQSAPAAGTTEATPAAATPAPVEDPTNGVVKAIPAADPKDAQFKRFDQFPILLASGAFAMPKGAIPKPAATETGGTTGTTGTGTTTTTTTTTTPTTSTNVRTNAVNIAQVAIDGKAQTLQVSSQIPATSPMFTVQSIDAAKVTLKLNSGTFPGGSSTIDIAAGASVTLSNPTTGAAIFILVKSIMPVAV
jgi:hypothetical protein